MKKLYVPVVTLLTLASCSKSELANRPVVENDMVEIMATSKALTIETRAPFEGQIADGNNLTAVVLGSTTSGDYTEYDCRKFRYSAILSGERCSDLPLCSLSDGSC